MSRSARPTSSPFGNLLRNRRGQLGLSRVDLASWLGWSQSFVDVLEAGKRGCDLDDLPRLAGALEVNPATMAQIYLRERHPELYRALFGERQPDAELMPDRPVVEDVLWRLEQLPRRERGIVEALVYALYDLCHRRPTDLHIT
ncbi:MAG: helix-turn-helix domain-containing protein [Acidobacteriales bacterium]|nr:helix-turn-helix domain-containing protein [Terriglobales bacterium]